MCKVAEDVLFLQRLYQGTLVLIRDEVTAFAVRTDLEGVQYLKGHSLVAHGAPESGFVLVRRASNLGFAVQGFRGGGQRAAGRTVKLQIQYFLAFKTIDFLAHPNNISLHLFVGGCVLKR